MGVFEPTQEGWNGSLQKFLGEKKEWDDEIRFGRSFNMLTVDFPRLFCAFMDTRAFCSTPAPIIDMRKFQYGWTVYKFQ
jgi:hypothetical protein